MKTKILILFAAILGLAACESQDIEFEDFGSTSVYFPFQTPARTLILGKYEIGLNEEDNLHQFEIGVTMTGVYSNKSDRKVYFETAPELLSEVVNVKALPASHYEILTESPVTIPVGSTKGRIKVQLTDAFFTDTLSFASLNNVNYVVPLVITGIEELDSVLSGVPFDDVPNPSRVNSADWEIAPKDYTLYGIKFINKFHGQYLRRGVDIRTDGTTTIDTDIYHAEFVERDEVVKLTTTGESSIELSKRVMRGDEASPGSINFELVFDGENNATVRSFGDDAYNVTGTGKFVENGDYWGGKERDVIYLDYTYSDTANNEVHNAKDTLVIRNRDVVFEEFSLEFSVDQ